MPPPYGVMDRMLMRARVMMPWADKHGLTRASSRSGSIAGGPYQAAGPDAVGGARGQMAPVRDQKFTRSGDRRHQTVIPS